MIGFSDIQKDIAKELIGQGINVFISNHRSLQETLQFLACLARMVDQQQAGERIIDQYRANMEAFRLKGLKRKIRPRVYLEEWDDPMIRGIQWFQEVVEICGGEDIFKHKAGGCLGKERIIDWNEVQQQAPDIILSSWCGKPVDLQSYQKRAQAKNVPAIVNQHIYELPSEVILQPGPALFKDGFQLVSDIFDRWEKSQLA